VVVLLLGRARMTRVTMGLVFVLALAGLAGCNGLGATGGCATLGNCGGDPTGTWKIENVCQFAPVKPAQATDIGDFLSGNASATLAPPQPNASVLTQTSSGDWCSQLVYASDGTITNANLWHEAPSLRSGTVALLAQDPTMPGVPPAYTATYNFATSMGSSDPQTPDQPRDVTHFAANCLVANAARSAADPSKPPTCNELEGSLTKYFNAQTPPAFNDVNCAATADGGCDCNYFYTLAVVDTGSWSKSPTDPTMLLETSTLITFNNQELKAQDISQTLDVTYCAQNNQLELSGADGRGLSNLSGLRTLTLSRM
jgi:hypothetical protein